jgi:hypothetical protein
MIDRGRAYERKERSGLHMQQAMRLFGGKNMKHLGSLTGSVILLKGAFFLNTFSKHLF